MLSAPAFLLRLILLPSIFLALPGWCRGQSPSAGQTSSGTSLPGAKDAASNPHGQPAATDLTGGKQGTQGGDSKSASGTDAKPSASGKMTSLSPLAPAPAPAKVFARQRIGLALGGGGALALSEVGVLQWFEEHHIPVDVIAGTSMGCMVSALYSTGRTPKELQDVMNDKVFASVFSFTQTYTSRSFRRREDARELPNGITIGLRHGVSFRNALLTDQGLNAFLDRQFLRYDDQTDFNTLPIPLRCVSTDLNEARPVTFARGSIPDAVRASVSLPGVYQPFEMNGHEYVDGGVLDNLPTSSVHAMDADVVLAVSLPLSPVSKGDLNSILGVLQRSFSVAIEGAEREQRKQAKVVIMPDLQGFTANDYLKTIDLAKRGYAAAEANREALLAYALSDADWQAYLVHRASLRRGPSAPVLRVRVDAPTQSATLAIQRLFAPLVNQPVDTRKIEALLDQIRADGRYEADYTVGYESAQQFAAQAAGRAPLPAGTVPVGVATAPSQLPQGDASSPAGEATQVPAAGAPNPKAGTAPTSSQPGTKSTGTEPAGHAPVEDRPGAPGLAATAPLTAASLADISNRPVILVTVADKKTGPPFLRLGANVEAQTTAVTRATVEGILTDQDLGGYGSELRSDIKLGYLTELGTEYFRPFNALSGSNRTFFAAPHASLLRQPFSLYQNQFRLADSQLQHLTVGGDLGLTNERTQELRAGLDFTQVRWTLLVGQDNQPSYDGGSQRAHIRYAYDNQDRALVPQFGVRIVGEAAYLYDAVGSPNAPQVSVSGSYAHRFHLPGHNLTTDPNTGKKVPNAGKEVFLFGFDSGTMFDRNVAQPFRYTLGGPMRLSASAIDEYRGTDFFMVAPGLLRRIAQLPQPLGQSIYVGATYELGQMYAPYSSTITRQDVLFGLVAETPLGVITIGPAIGTDDHRKFVFTLGKFF
jgi:NTE family protein